ncbi:hypothetical protein J5N97_021651 [Dioscorea zingiberensis]|uniref:Uncharacterized protein n=1 Tax=Dioscorea zingiberensis TaxID=325984 RepID=A0A9D5C9G3_9LILI|nr:hypothetical protein J5N97_021651 [Dioscorea zingiberensis]
MELAPKRFMFVFASLCVLLSVVGAGLLLRWAVAFHQHNEQLWMVPVGLVMLGTPIVVSFSILASKNN